MRSDSLIRLDPPDRHYSTTGAREEINRHVEEFLAAGGEVRQIPSYYGIAPDPSFNYAAPETGQDSDLRIFRSGCWWLRRQVVRQRLAINNNTLNFKMRRKTFPRPTRFEGVEFWRESDVTQWQRDNGILG